MRLEIHARPSRTLLRLALGVHGAAVLAMLATPLVDWLQAILLIALVSSGLAEVARAGRLAAATLIYDSGVGWLLADRSGLTRVDPLPASRVFRTLLLLRLRQADGPVHTLALATDGADPEALRRFRVLLRAGPSAWRTESTGC